MGNYYLLTHDYGKTCSRRESESESDERRWCSQIFERKNRRAPFKGDAAEKRLNFGSKPYFNLKAFIYWFFTKSFSFEISRNTCVKYFSMLKNRRKNFEIVKNLMIRPRKAPIKWQTLMDTNWKFPTIIIPNIIRIPK